MANTHGAKVLGTKEVRAKARDAMLKNNKKRALLVTKFGGNIVSYGPKYILETITEKNIPLSAIPKELLPKHAAEQLASKDQGGVGIPLEMIPERKPTGAAAHKTYTRKSSMPNPNEAIILRVLDMLETTKNDKLMDKLATLLDKLV